MGLLRRYKLIVVLIGLSGLVIFAISSLSVSPFRNDSSLLTNVTAIKIRIEEEGIHSIKLNDLRKIGVDSSQLDQGQIQMSLNGEPVPYLLEGDRVIFYGRAPETRYASGLFYVLEMGQVGRQMRQVESTPDEDLPTVSTIRHQHHLEENLLYDSRARYVNSDSHSNSAPWYWMTINPGAVEEVAFDLDRTPSGPATLSIALWGATRNDLIDNDHDLSLWLNDRPLTKLTWDGESHFLGEVPIPEGLLRQSDNILLLDNSEPGATPIDIMRLDWLNLVYSSSATASADTLLMEDVSGVVLAQGFSDRPLIFDITDENNPEHVIGWSYDEDQAQIASTAGKSLIAVGPEGLRTPPEIGSLRPTALKSADIQADMIIIASQALLAELDNLVSAREQQGLSVRLVALEEVYDNFGYGQESPDSITSFLRYAYGNWQPPRPKYLLLIGDATYDYAGFASDVPDHVIPAPMVEVEFSGETTSDAQLVNIDGDNIPEIAVGRWTVRTPAEVEALVSRTLAYETGSASPRAIFAADGTSPEFRFFNSQVATQAGFDPDRSIQLSGQPAEELARQWNNGAWLVSYVGHGSLDRWGKDDVFSNDSVSLLSNTSETAPIVLHFTCLTGYYAHPEFESLAEKMLLSSTGPVLVIAPSSLTVSSSQRVFANALLKHLKDPKVLRIGDALQMAKSELNVEADDRLRQISDTFGLLGDPSALIVRP